MLWCPPPSLTDAELIEYYLFFSVWCWLNGILNAMMPPSFSGWCWIQCINKCLDVPLLLLLIWLNGVMYALMSPLLWLMLTKQTIECSDVPPLVGLILIKCSDVPPSLTEAEETDYWMLWCPPSSGTDTYKMLGSSPLLWLMLTKRTNECSDVPPSSRPDAGWRE